MQVTFTFEAKTKTKLYSELLPVLIYMHKAGVYNHVHPITKNSVSMSITGLNSKTHIEGLIKKVSAMSEIIVVVVIIGNQYAADGWHDDDVTKRLYELQTTRVGRIIPIPARAITDGDLSKCMSLFGIDENEQFLNCDFSVSVEGMVNTPKEALAHAKTFNLQLSSLKSARSTEVQAALFNEQQSKAFGYHNFVRCSLLGVTKGVIAVDDIKRMVKMNVVVFGYAIELFHKNTKYIDVVLNFKKQYGEPVTELVQHVKTIMLK